MHSVLSDDFNDPKNKYVGFCYFLFYVFTPGRRRVSDDLPVRTTCGRGVTAAATPGPETGATATNTHERPPARFPTDI